MFKSHIKNKNAKFANDNEFVNNHWQYISHFEKTD